MATLEEVENAIRQASAKGDKQLVLKLAEARKQLMSAGPGGPTPEGEVGWITPVDDTIRVIADTATRGYADKLFGEEAQQHTLRSRARMNDLGEAATDIGTAVMTAPYRVGSTLWGGAAGALEGAADAYGHQPNWVPNLDELGDIVKQAGIGAIAGSGAAEAGKWIGKGINRYKSPDSTDLYKTADRATKRKDAGKVISPAAEDKIARANRLSEAKVANAEGRGGFEKMLAGMDQPKVSEADKLFGKVEPPKGSRNERELLAKLAYKPGPFSGIAIKGGRALSKLKMFGLPAVAGMALQGIGHGLDMGRPADWAKLQREIMGKMAEKGDKAVIDAGRNKLSRTAVAGTKAYYDNDEKPKKK